MVLMSMNMSGRSELRICAFLERLTYGMNYA